MSYYLPTEELAPLGAICLNYTDDIHRPPGDPLNAVSYEFPIIHEMVENATLWEVVKPEKFPDDVLEHYIIACQKLEKKGCIGIITSCGFLAQAQSRLAEKINIPIAASSLMQIPSVLTILSPSKKIAVLTFNAEVLSEVHFNGVGVTNEMLKRVSVSGCKPNGALQRIIVDGDAYIHEELEEELVDMAQKLLENDPKIGAFVLECTQMPPFAKAIQKATGKPVYDAITMINWFYSGLRCRTMPDDEFKKDGLRKRVRSDKEKR